MGVKSDVGTAATKIDASTHIDSHDKTNITLNFDMGQVGRMGNYFDQTIPSLPGGGGNMGGFGAQNVLDKLSNMVIPLLQVLKSMLPPMNSMMGVGGMTEMASYQSPFSYMSGSPRMGFGSVY